MKIKRNDFLIQVKCSDILKNKEEIGGYFAGLGAELYLSPEEIVNFDIELLKNIKSFTEGKGLPLRLHAPITEIDYSRLQDTASEMRSLYDRVVELCRILNINFVVAHAEFNYRIGFSIDEQLENAIFLWGDLLKKLKDDNIALNIENHFENKPDHLIALMERIDSPHFKMCVDVGHFNAFSDLGMKKWMEKYPAGSVKEVHLADNKGDDDTHIPVGSGNIDFAKFFEILEKRNENCVFVLEPNNIDEARMSISFLIKAGFLE